MRPVSADQIVFEERSYTPSYDLSFRTQDESYVSEESHDEVLRAPRKFTEKQTQALVKKEESEKGFFDYLTEMIVGPSEVVADDETRRSNEASERDQTPSTPRRDSPPASPAGASQYDMASRSAASSNSSASSTTQASSKVEHSFFDKTLDVLAFPEKHVPSPNCAVPDGRKTFEDTMDVVAFPERHLPSPNCAVPDGRQTFEDTMDVVAFPERHLSCGPVYDGKKHEMQRKKAIHDEIQLYEKPQYEIHDAVEYELDEFEVTDAPTLKTTNKKKKKKDRQKQKSRPSTFQKLFGSSQKNIKCASPDCVSGGDLRIQECTTPDNVISTNDYEATFEEDFLDSLERDLESSERNETRERGTSTRDRQAPSEEPSTFERTMDVIAFPERHVSCAAPACNGVINTVGLSGKHGRKSKLASGNKRQEEPGEEPDLLDRVFSSAEDSVCSESVAFPERSLGKYSLRKNRGRSTRKPKAQVPVGPRSSSIAQQDYSEASTFEQTRGVLAPEISSAKQLSSSREVESGGQGRPLERAASKNNEPEATTFEQTMDIIAFPERHVPNCPSPNCASPSVSSGRRAQKSGSRTKSETSTFEQTMDVLAFPERHVTCGSPMSCGAGSSVAHDESRTVSKPRNGLSQKNKSIQKHRGTSQPDMLDFVCEGVQRNVCRSDDTTFDYSYPVVRDDGLEIQPSLSCNSLSCTEPIHGPDRTNLDLLEMPELRRDRSLVSESSADTRERSNKEKAPSPEIEMILGQRVKPKRQSKIAKFLFGRKSAKKSRPGKEKEQRKSVRRSKSKTRRGRERDMAPASF